MAKVKLSANAELDLLNHNELRSELDRAPAWFGELTRGVKFHTIAETTTADGAGVWSIRTGPRNGFVWAVTRIAISGPGWDPTADTADVFVDEATPLRLVTSGVARSKEWHPGGLVIDGAGVLIVQGSNATASKQVSVSGQAIEVPVQLQWRLIG